MLCREVGSAAIMVAQLAHLHDMIGLANVDVRVLPFESGLFRAHAGHFVILEIPADLGSDVVLIEGHAGSSYLDAESDVDLYKGIHTEAWDAALAPAESRAVISAQLSAYRRRTAAQAR